MTDVTAPPAYRQRNPLWFAWRRFTGNKAAIVAGVVLALLILMAIFAPLITPYPRMISHSWSPLVAKEASTTPTA